MSNPFTTKDPLVDIINQVVLGEKKLTDAELKKREEIAKAMERDNPGMDMGKKMAIATAQAKKVAEEVEELDEAAPRGMSDKEYARHELGKAKKPEVKVGAKVSVTGGGSGVVEKIYDKELHNGQKRKFIHLKDNQGRDFHHRYYAHRVKVMEEIEQIDEVGNTLKGQIGLRDYKEKAKKDMGDAGEKLWYKSVSDKDTKGKMALIRQRDKRRKGIQRADARIKKEEFEQIDEISAKTLATAAHLASDPDSDYAYDKSHDANKFAKHATKKFGSKIGSQIAKAASGAGHFPKEYGSSGKQAPYHGRDKLADRTPSRVTAAGKANKQDVNALKTKLRNEEFELILDEQLENFWEAYTTMFNEAEDQQQNILLRAMAKDPSDLMKMKRAIKMGDKALTNPALRQEILAMLDKMMHLTTADPSLLQRTRMGFQKAKTMKMPEEVQLEAIGAKDKQDEGEYGYEGDMAMSQLRTIIRNCQEMMKVLDKETDMPEWVQSKITLATDYLQTANDYLMSELEEETEINELSKGLMYRYFSKADKSGSEKRYAGMKLAAQKTIPLKSSVKIQGTGELDSAKEDKRMRKEEVAKDAPFEGGREVKSNKSAAERVKKIAKGMEKHYTKDKK